MEQDTLKHILPYAVNFSIFAVILVALIRNPFKKFVFQRHERIKDFLGASAKAGEEAEARIAKANALIHGFAAESRRVMAEEVVQAKQDAAQIVEKARQDAARVSAEAKKIAENETQELSDSVRMQFLSQAIAAADKDLRASLKKEHHNKILSKASSRIEAGV